MDASRFRISGSSSAMSIYESVTWTPEDRLQIDVWWLIASPARRTRDSSSILERIVSFACSRAAVRKAIRRSISVDMVSHQEVVKLCSTPAKFRGRIKEVVLT